MSWKIKVFLWWGTKVLKFPLIDVKHDNGEYVEAITFATSEDYIDAIGKIEL